MQLWAPRPPAEGGMCFSEQAVRGGHAPCSASPGGPGSPGTWATRLPSTTAHRVKASRWAQGCGCPSVHSGLEAGRPPPWEQVSQGLRATRTTCRIEEGRFAMSVLFLSGVRPLMTKHCTVANSRGARSPASSALRRGPPAGSLWKGCACDQTLRTKGPEGH